MKSIFKAPLDLLTTFVYSDWSGEGSIQCAADLDDYRYFIVDSDVPLPESEEAEFEAVMLTTELAQNLREASRSGLNQYLYSIDEKKVRHLNKINEIFESRINYIVSSYPKHEIDSWSKQEAEARAYMLDDQVDTPLVSAIAVARGVTVEFLVDKIILKADAFATYSGGLIGKRQALEDTIKALSPNASDSQLEAIIWVD